jgi:hypothetical protein
VITLLAPQLSGELPLGSSDPDNSLEAIAVMKERLKVQGGRLNALVNSATIYPRGREDAGGAASRPITATYQRRRAFLRRRPACLIDTPLLVIDLS